MFCAHTECAYWGTTDWQYALLVGQINYAAYFDSTSGINAFGAYLAAAEEVLAAAQPVVARLGCASRCETLDTSWLHFVDSFLYSRKMHLEQVAKSGPLYATLGLHRGSREGDNASEVRGRIQAAERPDAGFSLRAMRADSVLGVSEWSPGFNSNGGTFWGLRLGASDSGVGGLFAPTKHELDFFRGMLVDRCTRLLSVSGALSRYVESDRSARRLQQTAMLTAAGDHSWVSMESPLWNRIVHGDRT